jgi:hypothetical protein
MICSIFRHISVLLHRNKVMQGLSGAWPARIRQHAAEWPAYHGVRITVGLHMCAAG